MLHDPDPRPAEPPKGVLVVEDELIVAEDLRLKLVAMGFRVVGIVAGGEEAIAKTVALKPDLVLMDISLRGPVDGVEAARAILEKTGTPIVYVTGHGDPDTLQRAKATAGFSFVLKPVDERELHYVIEMALHRHALGGPRR